ncbi:MAG: quinone-dependent dihydroorotate dehydrogenase [Pseudomonadota bacterium]|nr:quinone-dependent dihydroorotate dehydrogenase [Pseudomonadota bacterium]
MALLKPWLYLPVSWAHPLGHIYLKIYGKLKSPKVKKWRSLIWKDLVFPNPLGIAGGVDKSGDSIQGWWSCGAGFLEVGTVTPLPQNPNPGKILARDIKNLAVWNRLGFPSLGMEHTFKTLANIKKPWPTPVLINVGKNRSTPNHEAHNDYLAVMNHLNSLADVFVINISSPNTIGLRDLQSEDALKQLLDKTLQAYRQKNAGFSRPILLKLSPDLNQIELEAALNISLEFEIDGWILSNTTLSRYSDCPFPTEGGVSGKPLAKLSLNSLKLALNFLGSKRTGKLLISVGGISSHEDIEERLALGANLVQVYSALIYNGPGFFSDMSKASSP